MKKVFITLMILVCFSYKNKTIAEYYYSTSTYHILKISNNNNRLIKLRDSTYVNNNFEIIDPYTVQIDYVNYRYKLENDSLTLYDFPDDPEFHNDKLVLAKFNFKETSPENLNNKSWSMKIEKENRNTGELFLEEQILNFKTDCYASYLKDSDTILGATYYLDDIESNEFTTYSRDKYNLIIPIIMDNKHLEIILFDGFQNNRIYNFERIE